MRAPTTSSSAYAWHRKAMAGEKPPIHESEPQPGWYKRRTVKGGPFVPARIFYEAPIDAETGELTGDEKLACEVNGKRVDPLDQWTWLAGEPISRGEYLDMMAARFADAADLPPKYHF